MDLTKLSIAQAHKGLKNKDFTSVELTKAFLDRIKKENKRLSVFLEVEGKLALAQAKEADKMISSGKISLLTGIPLSVKDNIMTKGIKTTCASKILEHYVAPYDATCIEKLKKEGAVILGKTNLDEFAMGASTENSGFFTTKNPADIERVPGGSSGGSAASVAADLCCYSLGSDTGGSIRQPAAFCGVVGLKPTYGSVSRYGLVAFASSLDQIGPITKTAEDAKIVFNAISGKDSKDSTSVDFESKKSDFKITGLKIGVPKEYFIDGMDSEVEKKVRNTIDKLKDLGADIKEISLPHTKYVVPVYYLINTSEASTNLARYDGIRYGASRNRTKDLLEVYLKSRGQGFGDEVKRRIMLGTYALSSGYYDAYYLKAQKVRTLIKKDFDDSFKNVDVILTPTTPTTAWKIGEKEGDLLSMYLADIFTASINLVGLPAVSMPLPTEGLPIGLQIIGKPFEENLILDLAQEVEKNG